MRGVQVVDGCEGRSVGCWAALCCAGVGVVAGLQQTRVLLFHAVTWGWVWGGRGGHQWQRSVLILCMAASYGARSVNAG